MKDHWTQEQRGPEPCFLAEMLGNGWWGMSVWCAWAVGPWEAKEGHSERGHACEWGFP